MMNISDAGDAPVETAERPDPAAGLKKVRRAIDEACARSGRSPDSVTLVAASKTVPVTGITDAIINGQRVFGENRVQEAKTKRVMQNSP